MLSEEMAAIHDAVHMYQQDELCPIERSISMVTKTKLKKSGLQCYCGELIHLLTLVLLVLFLVDAAAGATGHQRDRSSFLNALRFLDRPFARP